MQVYNLISKRSGRAVANQYCVITDDGTRYFRSYNSNICRIAPDGTIYLDEYYWNYSKTTSKYLAQFLETNNAQIHANVKAGIYKMINLNNA